MSRVSDPVRLFISNVRDTSFVVSWLTAEAEMGQVQLVDGAIYRDDRGEGFCDGMHYVTVAGLEENRTYGFDLVSSGKKYDHGGTHWTVRTGSNLPPLPPDLISGKITNSDGSAATDAIVFFTIDRQSTVASMGVSAPVSTLVTASDGGIFRFNLREARTMSDPSQYYAYAAEGDFRTTLTIAAVSAHESGLDAVDMGDKRLRSSDPKQMLVIGLSRNSK